MNCISFDVGTYTLISCSRDDKGNFATQREINAFLELPLEDKFVFKMMKDSGVPLIERDKVAYALGEAAVRMAYSMPKLELRRPMTGGCVNPKEKEAFQILKIMIHNLITGVKKDKTPLYYTVPANAINEETDADYHSKVLEAIFKSYRSDEGFTVEPHAINEALTLIYAELGKKAYTGISASFGAGMCNVCFAMYGNPVFSFALVNSGDWIDRQAARATGESVAFINREKTKIDLTVPPTNLIERAIQTQYRLMIEHTVSGLKKGLTDAAKQVRSIDSVDMVVAGGTSLPNGFTAMLQEVISQADLPMKIGEIVRPADPLYAVARGALIAAEAAQN